MLSCRLFSFKMILQFRLPAIEPEADVSIKGIKKGVNSFIVATYSNAGVWKIPRGNKC